MWETKDYVDFVSFLLDKGDTIMNRPIQGHLPKVCILYRQYLGSKKTVQAFNVIDRMESSLFKQNVFQFNDICPGSITLVEDAWETCRIQEIDKLKLALFLQLLDTTSRSKIEFTTSVPFEVTDFANPKHCLRLMLDNGNHSGIKPMVGDSALKPYEVYSTKKNLISLLEKETATSVLVKKRAKLSTIKKPFHVVCEDANHAKVLSKVCFAKKEMQNQGSGRPHLPSVEECHNTIAQSQKLISKATYECSKNKIHFLPIVHANSDVSLGDCSYLDTCHKNKNCRYLHYFSLTPKAGDTFNREKELQEIRKVLVQHEYTAGFCFNEFIKPELPAQWISCDIRRLPFSVLGKFAAIVSDPAWDIHMSLPYGTCSDEELMTLPMGELQDEGIMLLWVTGRSIETGRKALLRWGYKITDEIIWIKLNQLKRTIVTGRTGHWLNHSKEHLLVGLKGEPSWVNRLVDINTIVSPTRETSRKPDEVYDLVERITGKHARKLEIFGRDHNVRPGWFTIGNQLTGTSIHEREVLEKYQKVKNSKTKVHS